MHLSTALLGPVGGDTGVYVWNMWLFRHEILTHHHLPYFTTEILSLTAPIDLSLHNYTVFDDLLAFPLIPVVGIVASYNLVYLFASVLSASMMFALARRCCGSTVEAWLAGLLFAWSPALVARGEGHLSLVTAAALPAFVLAFERWWRSGLFVDAVLAGFVVAWALMCDPYYGVYCAMIALAWTGASFVRVDVASETTATRRRGLRTLDGMLTSVGVIIVAIMWSGGFEFRVLGERIQAHSLYTPVLTLTLLAIVRTLVRFAPTLTIVHALSAGRVLRGMAGAAVGCALPLAPFMMALEARLADGGRFHAPTLWRSSPRGADLLALFSPNPNNPLFGVVWRDWATRQAGGFVENVASLTFVALAVIGAAVWRYRFRAPRFWLVATIAFALISLGPFVFVGGLNTYVPGPWALLRYVPIVDFARMPARFAALMMLGLAVLFAVSLTHVRRQVPRPRTLLALVGVALTIELSPAPRTLYSAHVPGIYETIAHDPRTMRIMELPLGFRDGESSIGNFSASSQFYQTYHEKRLIGGYLSRIARRELTRQLAFPVIRTIVALSEGRGISESEREALLDHGPRFAARARLGYVVIDRGRTPEGLRQTAIDAFRLVKIGEDDGVELYRVPAFATLLTSDTSSPPVAPIER